MAIKKLTARFVETAKATGPRSEFRDTDAKGLELRVSESGTKTSALRYRRQSDGAKRTITLGSFPDYSLDDARKWALATRVAVSRGADPASERQARKEAETFAEVAAEWIERHATANRRPRTLQTDRYMLDRHVLPVLGNMKAGEDTKRDVIRLLDAVTAAPDARMRNA